MIYARMRTRHAYVGMHSRPYIIEVDTSSRLENAMHFLHYLEFTCGRQQIDHAIGEDAIHRVAFDR